MSIRDYLAARSQENISKGLEPTKCGLCGGSHAVTSYFMCGECHGGWVDYMGGGEAARKVRGGDDVTPWKQKLQAPTTATKPNSSRSEAIKNAGTAGAGEMNEPTAQGTKEGPRSEKDGAYQ